MDMSATLNYIILTERECDHCQFRAYLPKLEPTQRILCPHCWKPFAHPEEVVTTPAAPAVRFNTFVSTPAAKSQPDRRPEIAAKTNAARSVPEPVESACAEPVLPPQEDPVSESQDAVGPLVSLQTDDTVEELNVWAKFRRWNSSYGVSFCVHAALLGLAALIVFQSTQLDRDSEIDSSFSQSDALFAFDQMTQIEVPEITFQPELSTVSEFVTSLEAESDAAQSVAANNETAGEGNVGFFGTKAEGKSFAFIVDISGSMSATFHQNEPGQAPGVRTRWSKAREELLNAIDSMTPAQAFSVTLYNSSHYSFQPEPGSSGLCPATKANKQALRDWLNTRFSSGGTDPRSAIEQALTLKPEVVFLLTDGIIPYESRNVALAANKSESIIHTTCIGSIENEILQLIAQDHRGIFRAVVDARTVTGPRTATRTTTAGMSTTVSSEVTLVCIVSNSPTDLTKFRRLQDTAQNYREALSRGDLPINKNSANVLVLHNAASTLPEFNVQLQRLLREVNSGLRLGLQKELVSGRLGMGLDLADDRPREFRGKLEATHARTSTIAELFQSVGPAAKDAPPPVTTVIVFGDRGARLEVLSSVEVYNLYNGSRMHVLDGEEILGK